MWPTMTMMILMAAGVVPPPKAPPGQAANPAQPAAEIVGTATLVEVTEGGYAKSLPPVWLLRLEFTDAKTTRGTLPASFQASFGYRADEAPRLIGRRTCTFTARRVGDEIQILTLDPPLLQGPNFNDLLQRLPREQQ